MLRREVEAAAFVLNIRRTGVKKVQLVDEVEREVYGAIRAECPAVRIVQVVHVRERDVVEQAHRAAEWVDALLLDSGNPFAAVRELGGTGRTHDWTISREIVERAGVPVFLAGGIRAENVREAVVAVRPFGIDLCSGVRTNGALDGAKLQALVSAMHSVAT